MISLKKKKSKLKSIAVIGNYLPRQCGIATFTTDISNAISDELGYEDNVAAVVMLCTGSAVTTVVVGHIVELIAGFVKFLMVFE